ncbi:unnamed protein product [Hymenolepis diminuta]|uniref:DAO domain-containing protein n=1 Tax=Hymenolepis diminuta TaxID=6216 RepID=A0A0R3STL4_HYMDI|nr:unnamed protein product [Hymenolepis diminuta]
MYPGMEEIFLYSFLHHILLNSQLLGGAVPRGQNPITLQTSCAFQAEPKNKNGEFAFRDSQNSRQQTKRSLMNNLEIINPDTNSERLDIFINTKEVEEVGAHLIVLSASFPVFGNI